MQKLKNKVPWILVGTKDRWFKMAVAITDIKNTDFTCDKVTLEIARCKWLWMFVLFHTHFPDAAISSLDDIYLCQLNCVY